MSDEVTEVGLGLGGQKLFCNCYTHNLDAKKRLTIPTDWRELVGTPKRVFLLQGLDDRYVRALPAYEMARRMEKLQSLSLSDATAQAHIRTLASRSDLVAWDAQGRIRLRDDFLEYAGIGSEVVLVGAFNGFELWSPEVWKQKQAAARQVGLADAVKFFGL